VRHATAAKDIASSTKHLWWVGRMVSEGIVFTDYWHYAISCLCRMWACYISAVVKMGKEEDMYWTKNKLHSDVGHLVISHDCRYDCLQFCKNYFRLICCSIILDLFLGGWLSCGVTYGTQVATLSPLPAMSTGHPALQWLITHSISHFTQSLICVLRQQYNKLNMPFLAKN